VRLGRGKPSFFWGTTGILAGLATGILAFPLLTSAPHPLTFGSFALSVVLCFFGYRNVMGAAELSRWERFGKDDDKNNDEGAG